MNGTPTTSGARLLSGPPLDHGAESFDAHQARLGARPHGTPEVIGVLKASGLTGRGGAGFPAWRKWAVVAERARGRARLVVNGSEGEPASRKDQTLLRHRPHLVLDGVQLAAETIGASEGIVYLSRSFDDQRRALEEALAERRCADADSVHVNVVTCPHRYVAGEASAVVHASTRGSPNQPPFRLARSSAASMVGRPWCRTPRPLRTPR